MLSAVCPCGVPIAGLEIAWIYMSTVLFPGFVFYFVYEASAASILHGAAFAGHANRPLRTIDHAVHASILKVLHPGAQVAKKEKSLAVHSRP